MASRSEVCAKMDGIESYEITRYRGKARIYKVPCAQCGEIVERKQYLSENTYLCDVCKYKRKNPDWANKEPRVYHRGPIKEKLPDERSRKERAFDNAVINIKKQVKDFAQYEKAVELAERRLDDYGSMPEVVVAIELLRLGHKVIPQQKVGKYRVDFALPNLKMIIEVDGEIYHRNKFKGDREAIIQFTLGLEWKIVHVPAELISKDIRKLKKIIEMNTCNNREKL